MSESPLTLRPAVMKAIFVLSLTYVASAATVAKEVDVSRKGFDAVIENHEKDEGKEDVSRELEMDNGAVIGCGFDDLPCCHNFKCRLADTVCDPFQGTPGVGLCVSCGEEDGAPCCEGMKCTNEVVEEEGEGDDLLPLVCTFDGLCAYCGAEGQPCCGGHAECESGLTCSDSGMCVSCGSEAEVCCDGMKCMAGEMTACDEQNICTHCGGPMEQCCDGMKCGMLEPAEDGSAESLALGCGVSGLCEFCGGMNEQCCFNGAEFPVTVGSDAGYHAAEGICGIAYREYCLTVSYRGACAKVAASGFPTGGEFHGLCNPEVYTSEEEEEEAAGGEIDGDIGQEQALVYGGGGRYPQAPKAVRPPRFKCCACMAVDLACDLQGICRMGSMMI